MLYNGLEWDKRVLTNLDHERQLYNTVIPPSHEGRPTNFTLEWIRGLMSNSRPGAAVHVSVITRHRCQRRYTARGVGARALGCRVK